jgi:hypothetical protein
MTDDVARLRAAFAAASETARPRQDCPDPGRLWDAAHGALEPADTRALVDHTATCPACAEAWRLAAAIEDEAAARPAQVTPIRPRARRVWMWPAAAAIAAAAVTIVIVRSGREEVPGYRDGTTAPIDALVPETVPQPRDALVLRWRGGPDGARWDVRVMTNELALVHRASDLAEAEHRVPPDALAELPAGTTLLWQVEARIASGRVSSRTFKVTLR